MNRIRKILLATVLAAATGMAYSSDATFSSTEEAWLWGKSAEPIELDTNSSRTVIECTAEKGCVPIIVINDNSN